MTKTGVDTILVDAWPEHVSAMREQGLTSELLATGYSCRSQVHRMRDRRLRHPVEVLLEHLTGSSVGLR